MLSITIHFDDKSPYKAQIQSFADRNVMQNIWLQFHTIIKAYEKYCGQSDYLISIDFNSHSDTH